MRQLHTSTFELRTLFERKVATYRSLYRSIPSFDTCCDFCVAQQASFFDSFMLLYMFIGRYANRFVKISIPFSSDCCKEIKRAGQLFCKRTYLFPIETNAAFMFYK